MIRAMTDRGIPSIEGAPACPFVAFDDDRDARATAPDHRHRCFAEPTPAPRALAHQDAYCLSPAFAVCPAFQDWARREAAAARPSAGSVAAAPAPRLREEDTSGPVPMPPVQREPRHAPPDAARPIPPRRQPARDWAAPPPWVGDDGEAPDEPPVSTAPGAIPGWGASGASTAGAGPAGVARSRAGGDWSGNGRGLADSSAARVAGPDPDLPVAARPVGSWRPAAADDDDDGYEDDDAPSVPPSRPQSAPANPFASRSDAPSPPNRPVAAPRTPSARDGARPTAMEPQELFGPAWERPRRYEAYPSLRTRVGLPSFAGVPRLAVAGVALVVAAVLLFFVAPMILNLGSHSPAASPALSPASSEAPSDSPVPTVAPPPTATTYTVKAHDTFSAIAQQFGVTVKALQKANPQVKNVNTIKIGDVLNIPVPKGAAPSGAVSGASPSAVLGASAAP